jgi:hypothetical protein
VGGAFRSANCFNKNRSGSLTFVAEFQVTHCMANHRPRLIVWQITVQEVKENMMEKIDASSATAAGCGEGRL